MNIQDWTLYYDNFGPLSCQAPCTMYSVLYDHGKIPDPFYGTNERELQYLAEKDCVFESVFSAPPALFTREHIELVFHGLDTICHIYLNGTLLGKVKNMHREYVYEVKPLLTAGENTLRLEFKSPRRYFAQQQHKHYLYMNDGDTLPGAAHLRKAMYQSGWDWGPTLPDMGIFRGVELKGWNVDRFDGVAVRQHHENGSVSVELDVTTKCHAGCEIYADFDGKRVLLKNGHGIIKVDNPKLWWARGYGDQPLYDLDVELICGGEVIDRCHKQLGLRTLTVSTEPDADGKGSEFCFVLNGVKIFSMGANLVPMDNLLSRITDQRWETIVRQAVDANFNTLRVWGGGYYPDSRFYELCDQYGLLVWQDFMVACANIYLTSEMAEEFTQEAICNLKRLHHHASLALLCGNNEMEMFMAGANSALINHRTWEFVPTYPHHITDYVKMFEYILPAIVKETAPQTYWWPASPSSGGNFDAPNDENRGDNHYWDVWHGEKPFTEYRKFFFRYASEFGFQSFPCLKSVKQFTLPDDRNIFSRVMERHQRNQAANGKILSYLSQTFRYPNSFDDLLYASQLMQAEAIRYGVEHWRRNRGRCMGAIIWQLNDIWPVASWASIDYYGRWKALHYAAKRFFAPVMISAEEEGELSQNPKINEYHPAPLEKSFRLNVCNETLRDVTGEVVWALRTPDGAIVRQNQQTLTIPAMSAKWLDKVDCADASLTGHYVSFAFVVDDVALSEGTCIFCAPKHFEFVDPRLTVETRGDTLVVTSHAYAKQVWLESEDADLLLDDNAFDMNPGTKVVRVVKGTAEKVRVRSVWDLGR